MPSLIHREWYNANEARAYPLDDVATQVGDNGNRIPENVLAGLNLRVPDTLTSRIFVSGLTLTEHLATVTFSVDVAGTYQVVAAATVAKPVNVFQNYVVTASYRGSWDG